MISIIIPTLNEEKIIEKTLKALCELNVVDYEIIVSDGGSKDKTVEIAQKFAHTVVVHTEAHRQSIGEGRNLGASKAKGDYLLFIDADVFIPNINKFFIQVLKDFEQDPNLSALTVFLKVLPEHVTISDSLFFGMTNRLCQFSNNVLHIGMAAGEFQMIRASSFKQVGGFNPAIVVGEDNDLFARISKIGKTRVETGLYVMHTSRRAHDIGWFKLLTLWWVNLLYLRVFKKSLSKEWKPIR